MLDALEKVKQNHSEESLIYVSFGIYGQHFLKPTHDFDTTKSTVFVELNPNAGNDTSTASFIEEWRSEIDKIETRSTISVNERKIGLDSADLEIVISHNSVEELRAATNELTSELKKLDNLRDVSNSLIGNSQGFLIRPNAFSQTLRGISPIQIEAAVLRYLKSVYGEFSDNGLQQNWILRFGNTLDFHSNLESSPLSERKGISVGDVVATSAQDDVAPLVRRNGQLSTTITANYADNFIGEGKLQAMLKSEVFPNLTASYGTNQSFGGSFNIQNRTLTSIIGAVALSMILMYIVLAVSLGGYLRPIIVLVTLPIGVAAGITGHMVMGYPVTLLSLVALLGLSGIMVNDIVLLISALDAEMKNGMDVRGAILSAFKRRLRAISLTTITTIAGLLPLMLDQSPEAEFLVPIAISIVFGLSGAMAANFFVFPWAVIAFSE